MVPINGLNCDKNIEWYVESLADEGLPATDRVGDTIDEPYFGQVLPQAPVINPMRHVGRNDPCPCGSGKKAKRCCLAA